MSDHLRFGVLGPLVVRTTGSAEWDSEPIGGRKQRMLLAALLLNADRPVPMDRLVDTLWPNDPPRSAVPNIHTYVSGLRARLRSRPDREWITRRQSGYAIHIEPGELDLDVFDDLIGLAGTHASAGRQEEAIRCYDRAAELWRGDPLEDLPAMPEWRARTAGLIERRLEAVERGCALRIDAGRQAETVAQLRDLLADHPLREGLWRQLLLALYAGGRQAEALQAYAGMRERLLAELGTEPSDELRGIHRALLQGVTPPGGRKGRRDGPFPICQLPSDIPDFIGRRQVSGVLRARLSPARGEPPPTVVVTGPPGVGKSAFALHLGHRMRALFPDGQLYIDLTGDEPRDAGEVLVEMLRTFGVSGAAVPRSRNERAALYRSMLADRRVLVMIDNAADPRQVGPLLPATPGSAALITSRNKLTALPGAQHIELDVLRTEESIELLAKIAGEERTSGEPEQAAAIAAACGNLPLAVRIAGAKLSGRQSWSLGVLSDRLADESRRLSELQVGGLGVRATFEVSLRLLDPDAARTFRLLGLLGTAELPGWVIGALLGRRDATEVLDALIEASLVRVVRIGPGGEPRFRLHELLRSYAAEAAGDISESDRRAAIARVLAGWLALTERAAARLPASLLTPRPGTAPRRTLDADLMTRLIADPVAWFDTERRALLDAVALAATCGMAGSAWEIAVWMVPYFDQHSAYDDWLTSHQRALRAVRDAGDLRGEGALLRTLGQVYVYLDRYEDAAGAIARSRLLCQEVGDSRGVALAEIGLGTVQRVLGHGDQALRHYRAALPVVSVPGDRHVEAQVRGAVAVVLAAGGQLDAAQDWLETALRRARESADEHRQARILSQLGDLCLQRDEPSAAGEHLAQALAVFESLGDERCAGYALLGLARATGPHASAGEVAGVVDRALDIFHRTGNRRGRAAGLQVLGELRISGGDRRAGYDVLREAEQLLGEIGNEGERATVTARLAALSGQVEAPHPGT